MTDIGPIEIKLVASGIQDVLNAFTSLEGAVKRFEDRATQASNKGGKDRVRSAQAEEKAKEREYQKLVRETDRQQREMVRAEEKASREKVRIAEKEEKAKEAELRKLQRDTQRWLREDERAQNEHYRKVVGMAKSSASKISGAFSSAFSTIGRFSGMLVGLGGGLSISHAIAQEGALEKALLQGQRATGLSTSTLRGITQGTSRAYNLDDAQVATGFATYAKLNGTEAAKNDVPEIAKILKSQGMGDQLETITSSAAKMKSLNPSVNTGSMLRAIVGSGMSEADIADAMSNPGFGKMLLSSKLIGGPGTDADKQAKIVANFASLAKVEGVQAAMQETTRMPAAVLSKQKEWAKLGLNPLDKDGKVMDPQSLMATAIQKTHGNMAELQKLGLVSARGGGFGAMAVEAYNGAGGGDKGVKAMMARFSEMDHQIKSSADIQRDLDNVKQSDAEKFDAAMNELERTIKDNSIPIIQDLTQLFKQLTPYVGKALDGLNKLISWASNHPWEAAFATLGTLVTKAIVGQILSAAVEQAVAGALTKAIATASAGNVGGAAGGLGLSGVLAAGTVGAIALGGVGSVYNPARLLREEQSRGAGLAQEGRSQAQALEAGGAGSEGALRAADFASKGTLAAWNAMSPVQQMKVHAGANLGNGSDRKLLDDVAKAQAFQAEKSEIELQRAKMSREAADMMWKAALKINEAADKTPKTNTNGSQHTGTGPSGKGVQPSR